MTAVTPELLRRFDVPGPRYTSFPTADRFVEAFGAEDYILALEQRKSSTAARAMPLSLYVHVPFCESLCYYCACNKIVTRHHDRAAVYLDYLAREMALHTAHCGKGQAVSQLHLGGGTPTFFSDDELRTLMALLREHFRMEAGGEYSIEVDPRTVTAERLAVLRELGFNRLSFGVQDFDEQVQIAVHRVQPAGQVFELVAAARQLGCGPTASRCMPMPTCPSASSRSGASRQKTCPRAPTSSPCFRAPSMPSWKAATSMSAWTTSPCPRTRWPWPSARAGCTATSRDTAPSPTAT
jgi:hypothetical protein